MKTLKERLLKYWEAISGVRPDLSPSDTSALPLFLRERYVIFSARLLGRIFPLAIENVFSSLLNTLAPAKPPTANLLAWQKIFCRRL